MLGDSDKTHREMMKESSVRTPSPMKKMTLKRRKLESVKRHRVFYHKENYDIYMSESSQSEQLTPGSVMQLKSLLSDSERTPNLVPFRQFLLNDEGQMMRPAEDRESISNFVLDLNDQDLRSNLQVS